jgi:hypothetical protein
MHVNLWNFRIRIFIQQKLTLWKQLTRSAFQSYYAGNLHRSWIFVQQ